VKLFEITEKTISEIPTLNTIIENSGKNGKKTQFFN